MSADNFAGLELKELVAVLCLGALLLMFVAAAVLKVEREKGVAKKHRRELIDEHAKYAVPNTPFVLVQSNTGHDGEIVRVVSANGISEDDLWDKRVTVVTNDGQQLIVLRRNLLHPDMHDVITPERSREADGMWEGRLRKAYDVACAQVSLSRDTQSRVDRVGEALDTGVLPITKCMDLFIPADELVTLDYYRLKHEMQPACCDKNRVDFRRFASNLRPDLLPEMRERVIQMRLLEWLASGMCEVCQQIRLEQQ
ncbi:hypothetical protein DIPPA_60824 [Diplonema papillatum]|nr:hypothetical protein DIPPA_60824 [Diplonema papillatum]